MSSNTTTPSARQKQLLEASYAYALTHGLADLSLRPLATAIGSSPRVLLYFFGSKDGLIRALLARARDDELELLDRLTGPPGKHRQGLAHMGEQVWSWLSAPEHRPLLTLWVEGYARSLVEPHGPWADFARSTVEDWLALLSSASPENESEASSRECTLVLAMLRGSLLDLLATGDISRITSAVHHQLALLDGERPTGHR